MNIYIAGISGTGMGPLALMARRAGINVYGSDRSYGAIAPELERAGIEYYVGEQDGTYFKKKMDEVGIDWFIYTSALPKDHPELVAALESGIKVSKRDELIARLVTDLDLKMVAVAGTHGKTTTTSMLVWAVNKLVDDDNNPILPSSYLVGTTLGFAPSGSYKEGDKFFIYEADEYDRNFLNFNPWLSLITFVSYDHPDIYKTREDYEEAFLRFEDQSSEVIFGTPDAARHAIDHFKENGKTLNVINGINKDISISGSARREDATTAFEAIKKMLEANDQKVPDEKIANVLNSFPGVGRRFERITDGIYTDYAHHPEEVKSTVQMAIEEASKTGKKGVVVVYQPHQNTRQHEVRHLYKDSFDGADKVFWLPTYLTREDESLRIITPDEFITDLNVKDKAMTAELDDDLSSRLKAFQKDNYLIILMTAGPADLWLRKQFK